MNLKHMLEERFNKRFPKDKYAEFYIGRNIEYILDCINREKKSERNKLIKEIKEKIDYERWESRNSKEISLNNILSFLNKLN